MLPPLPAMASPFRRKQLLRLRMSAARDEIAKKRPDAGRHAARIFFENIPLTEDAVVSLFHPIRSEIDTKPLAEALFERGHKIALPATGRKKSPLVFREFRRGDKLEEDKFGVLTPLASAPEVRPTIIVAPLLAFTRKGERLGYGGGFYDRTLAMLRAKGEVLAVGYAFADQEVDKLPTTKSDERLDWIITEREAIQPSAMMK